MSMVFVYDFIDRMKTDKFDCIVGMTYLFNGILKLEYYQHATVN